MQRIALSSVDLAYVDCGAGTPVVLLHGFPLDHSMWSAQIDALSTTCRVIAPDLRGFGQSSLGNADPARGVSMEQYAEDVAALLDALAIREPIVLAGFSMGGYIAWQFVRKYTGRLRALVQCDTRDAADTDEARANRLKMAEHIHEWGSGRVAEMMGPRLFAAGKFESNPEIVQQLRRVVERTSPAAIAAAQRGMAARPDMTSILPKINVPALVIAGVEDALIPAKEMQQIATTIPNGQYVEIPNAGHMTTMENPKAVNAALQAFIGECCHSE
ncbi:MAG: alpha/beta hydrolase [Planctomycetes bacterium]|nr:alpha/beta hydrolase [Planctomycetota bacterium]